MSRSDLSEIDRATVVVIDDDPAICGALKFSLEIEGFRVLTFSGAEPVLRALDLPREGCLIVDHHLDEMNGLELIRALRARRILLPAILITSHPSKALREQAAAQGVPIVEKPLLSNALVEGIERAIGGPSMPAAAPREL